MSRSKRFITGLLSSYAAIGINILTTLASVPLALHYLDKEEFGLWALVTQISGYLILLELGMSGSVARTLADHKDDIKTGVYGSILKTGGRVFVIQGCAIVIFGMMIAWMAPSLLALPERLHPSFTILMVLQAMLTGLRLALGILSTPLWSHQRLDISNIASSVGLVISIITLWVGFHLGWHLYSLVVATATSTISGTCIAYIACNKLKLYPPRKYRGEYDPIIFKELFHFGSGLFLMNLGAQLTSASQVIVISRILGIESAAIWSIATKVFSMAQQFVLRIFDSSSGGLAEMIVRKEFTQLQKRFRDVLSITAVMAVTSSAGIALMNGPFIELWTAGKVTWAPWNNYLLACVLFTTTVTRCHVSLTGITKKIHGMKYIYLIEGISFILFSTWLVPRLELCGLLISALLCNFVITGIFGNWRTADYFGISFIEVSRWILRPFIILLSLAGIFFISSLPELSNKSAFYNFITGGSIFSLLVVPLIWFFGISPEIRNEIQYIITNIIQKIIIKFRQDKA